MLAVNALSAGYERPVIQQLSFEVATDEILAVIGPSGVGKSTLLKALLQLIPSSGSVMLNGNPISAKTHTLALVPQDYGLLPWQTVRKNIGLALQVKQHHRLTTDQQALVTQLMATLGLTAIADQYPNAISGGQRQRVALARAFALQPDLLLLDEAFSALDLGLKTRAQQLFLNQWYAHPTSTLLITHDLQEALVLSDQLLIMTKNGTEQRANPLAQLPRADRPQSAALFAAEATLAKEVAAWQD